MTGRTRLLPPALIYSAHTRKAGLLCPRNLGRKGPKLIAYRRVAVASQCMAPVTTDSRSDGRQAGKARQGGQGKARQGKERKAPRLQPSESADCDPVQAARSLNRPSSFPRPSQTRGYGGARTVATLYHRRRFDREGTNYSQQIASA
jgi:hypothetical protein